MGALRYGPNWAYQNPTNGRARVPAGRRASGPYRSRTFRRRQTPASPGASVPAGSALRPRSATIPLAAPGPDASFGLGTRRWEGYRSPMSRCVVVRGRFGTAPTGRTRTRRMVGPRYPQAGALRARTEVTPLAGARPQRAPALWYPQAGAPWVVISKVRNRFEKAQPYSVYATSRTSVRKALPSLQMPQTSRRLMSSSASAPGLVPA